MENKKYFTRVPNELLEGLYRMNLTGNEFRVMLCVIRRTYGYSKEFEEISLTDIAKMLGIRRQSVWRTLKKLKELNMIECHEGSYTQPQTLSVVGDCTEWRQSPVNETVNTSDHTGVNTDDHTAVNADDYATYKENKRNIKERERKKLPHGEYGKVMLTDEEYSSLKSEYGEKELTDYIRRADMYMQSTGKRYADHGVLIRKWMEDDGVKKPSDDISKYECVINRFR